MSAPLILSQFNKGIGSSAHDDSFALIRNFDIDSFPGALVTGPLPATVFHSTLSSTFSGVIATDVCTLDSGTVPVTSTAIKATTTANGLTANTVYFINKINSTTFYLYDTIAHAESGGATGRIDITGTGTMTIATVNPGTINHIVKDQRSGNLFMQDSNGRVWFGSSAPLKLLVNSVLDNAQVGSTALGFGGADLAEGNGIVLYKQNDSASTYWLLAFRNAKIDAINIYDSSKTNTPDWINGFDFGGSTASDSTLNSGAGSGNRHHAIVGQDDIVYFTDGRYVGSIKEASGATFNLGSSGSPVTNTHVGNDQALDTPTGEVLVHLEELGVNLLAASSTSNKIYPWDRISDSFNLPILVPEFGIQRMKNVGNLVYILAGKRGNIYTTQGTYARFFKKLPEQVTNNSATLQPNVITWGGVASLNGAFIFGAGVLTSGNSGVYMLYSDGRLVIDNMPSTGSANVTALYAENNFYYMGYASGADLIGTTRYASFNSVLQSLLYRVATKTEKATYSNLEIEVAKPATTGHIRISYRTDTSSAFTVLDTYTADSVATSFETDIGLIDIENIQVQVEQDGNFELVEVRLLP